MAKTRTAKRESSSLMRDRELVQLVMSGIEKGWAVNVTDDGEVVFNVPDSDVEMDDDDEDDVSCDECDGEEGEEEDDLEPCSVQCSRAVRRAGSGSKCDGELIGGLEVHDLPEDDDAIRAVRAILGMLDSRAMGASGEGTASARRSDAANSKVFALGDGRRVRVTVEAE